MTTGKVTKLVSDPRTIVVHVADPPPDGSDVVFADITADQFAVASAAYIKGSDVDVEGTPPACTKVTAK